MPPSDVEDRYAQEQNYLRDPGDVPGSFDDVDRGLTIDVDVVAASVGDTGFHLDGRQLWTDTSDESHLYVVDEVRAERFVLDADKTILCA